MLTQEWAEFVTAPSGPEGITRLMVDVTFLESSWGCTFGTGCTGIREPGEDAHHHGCCTEGAWLTSDDDRLHLERYQPMLTPEDWSLHGDPRVRANGGIVRSGNDLKTQVLDGACIYSNRDGSGCAFHSLANRTGYPVEDIKPTVCWMLPFRLEPDDDEDGVWTLRSWERADWTESGEDPGWAWWCVSDQEDHAHGESAYTASQPVWLANEGVLRRLVGGQMYDAIAEYLAPRLAGVPVAIGRIPA